MAESNPDYAGPEGTRLREEANKYGDQRHQLLDAANKAFESGDKAKAKQLSEQGIETYAYEKLCWCPRKFTVRDDLWHFLGKEAGKQMEATHKKAAAAILKHRNEGHGNEYLDLHGLLLEEAMDAVKERLVQEIVTVVNCQN